MHLTGLSPGSDIISHASDVQRPKPSNQRFIIMEMRVLVLTIPTKIPVCTGFIYNSCVFLCINKKAVSLVTLVVHYALTGGKMA